MLFIPVRLFQNQEGMFVSNPSYIGDVRFISLTCAYCPNQRGPSDILVQTLRKEGFFALYKGMASPLLGIAGVNSLLFAAYGASKRLISPYPQLSLTETAGAGALAGAVNAILASPGE